jgi:hypothetical protein
MNQLQLTSQIRSLRRRNSRFGVLALSLLAGFLLQAQDFQPLLDISTQALLHEALSGETAKEYVIEITRHHRIQGSRGYRDAAQYVQEELRDNGFKKRDAFIESFKSDGKVHYQTWQSPSGWDIDWAELRMVEPFEVRLVGYPEIAMSLMTYSNPGDVTAEMVWVGQGINDSDYDGIDVKGKFVLATGYGGMVHREAVIRRGAAAVICYLNDDRAADHPDMLAYTGIWPRTSELEQVTFGFNLSNRQGERLREMLESGQKVVMHGEVQGIGLEPYEMDVVVAQIPGKARPEEELIFVAHLDHPKESANDNASGSAALMDIAITLRRLIDAGRLSQPERTLRFLWVPEYYGTMAYIEAHPEMVGPELGGSVLASLNLDMVGEHLEIIHTLMGITQTPASLPSAVNDVVENMTGMVDRMTIMTPRGSRSMFNYRMYPYDGGSDHTMFIDRKIPGLMIGHWPDYTHHTSEDTPDKVDPVELERSEILSAGTMLYLANLDSDQALDLVQLTGANSVRRLGLASRRALGWLADAEEDHLPVIWNDAYNSLQVAGRNEKTAIVSILNFHKGEQVQKAVEAMQAMIDTQTESLSKILLQAAGNRGLDASMPPALSKTEDTRIPTRLTRGPIDFRWVKRQLPDAEQEWYLTGGAVLTSTIAFEIVNFIDGKHNISEVRNLTAAEFGPIETDLVARYVNDLERLGIIRWQ